MGRFETVLSWVVVGLALAFLSACSNKSNGNGGSSGDTVNGCTLARADDRSGQATVNITWVNPTDDCLLVDAGTTVNWNVSPSFTTHPLAGGETPTDDAGSLISSSDQSGLTASVTFAGIGDFPYFCITHTTSMQGVFYVR